MHPERPACHGPKKGHFPYIFAESVINATIRILPPHFIHWSGVNHPCFLSSLSLDASCYRYHNNIRDFHRGKGCEMAALLIYLAIFSIASSSAPSICPLTCTLKPGSACIERSEK